MGLGDPEQPFAAGPATGQVARQDGLVGSGVSIDEQYSPARLEVADA